MIGALRSVGRHLSILIREDHVRSRTFKRVGGSRVVRALACAAVLAVCHAAAASAQRVDGTVVDAETSAPISGATVLLVDDGGATVGRATSDNRGDFVVRAPRAGIYRLRTSRIGYREGISQPLDLVANGVVDVELRMSTGAVMLEPLTVRGVPQYRRLEASGFYERREHFGPEGLKEAVFLEQHDIERMNAFRVNDIFNHVRGVRTDRGGLRMRRNCQPAIVVDGVTSARGQSSLNFHGVSAGGGGSGREVSSPRSLVGVEVYYGLAVPARYMLDAGGCGVILFWTK
jgi:hypothetical protein